MIRNRPLISEVDQTMHDDLGLGPLAAESTVVHDLLQQYIPSAFAQPSLELLPLTVGDVATRMLNHRRLSPVDREGCRSLLGNPEPVPDRPSRQAVAELAACLEPANPLTERGWTFFGNAAIMTLMDRGRQEAHVAAGRQAHERYTRNQPVIHSVAESPRASTVVRNIEEAAARA
jgi:hypothetical protein